MDSINPDKEPVNQQPILPSGQQPQPEEEEKEEEPVKREWSWSSKDSVWSMDLMEKQDVTDKVDLGIDNSGNLKVKLPPAIGYFTRTMEEINKTQGQEYMPWQVKRTFLPDNEEMTATYLEHYWKASTCMRYQDWEAIDRHNRHAKTEGNGVCRSFYSYSSYYSWYNGESGYIYAATTPRAFPLQAFLLQRGMIVLIGEKIYEVVENRGGVHDFNPLADDFPNDSKKWGDFEVELILRKVAYDQPQVISLKGPANVGFRLGEIYIDEYKILMHEEEEEQFCLLSFSKYSQNRSDLQATTERIDEAKRVPCPKSIVEAVDRINDEGEALEDVAASMNLDPYQLKIYHEIFAIYDEGECDCVITVGQFKVSDGAYLRKTELRPMAVRRGDKI